MTSSHPKMRLVQSDAAISVAMVRREAAEKSGRDALHESTFAAPAAPHRPGGAIAVSFAIARRDGS
jgi:hypothetical protein